MNTVNAATIAADAPGAARRAAACLLEGGVALLPTDTVYGLAAHPAHPAAVARLFAIKGRPQERALPVMVSERAQIDALGATVTAAAARLLASPFMPGPLTLALALTAASRPPWLAGRDEVAVRLPAEALMLEVLAMTGPLFVTSANRHARPTPQRLADILAELAFPPALAVDGGARKSVPSTLVNCAVEPPAIEREGAVAAAAIAGLLA